MKFWDTSAIVPLLVQQPQTEFALGQREGDPAVLVWWGTSVECASALCRLERESRLTGAELEQTLENLRALSAVWHVVQPSRKLKALAQRLLRVHPLRAADSLQLAAALTLADGEPETVEFLSFDQVLSHAGVKEGLIVLPA